jgi:uncharacterized delta-60 repeat protein
MNIIRNVIWIVTVCLLQFFLAGATWALVTSTPTQEWVATFDGTESLSDSAVANAVDSDGNVYVTGHSDGIIIQTIKYDQNGNELWIASYEGPEHNDLAKALTVDAEGSVYVAGRSSNGSGYDAVTIKYNALGVEQWVIRTADVLINAIDHYVDSDDGNTYIYVIGSYTPGSLSSYDYTAIKYAALDGTEEWVARYDGAEASADVGTAMAVDGDGNIFVTGYSRGTADTLNDFATIKYNKDGIQQWVTRHTVGDGSDEMAFSIGLDSLGGVYVTGSTQVPYQVKGMLTVKYNSAGELQWEQINSVGSSYFYFRVTVDSSDNAIVSGNGLIIKYNSAGEQQWEVPVEARENIDIVVDGNDNLLVAGYIDGTSSSDRDFITVMYSSSGIQQWVQRYSDSEDRNDSPVAMAVYENAQTAYVVVTGSTGSYPRSDFATVVHDLSGTEIWMQLYNATGSGASGATDLDVDVSGNVYVAGVSDTGDGYNSIISKYSIDGTELWVTQAEGVSGGSVPVAVVVDSIGNTYVTATIYGNSDDIITIKYNPAGEVLGQVTYDGGFWDTVIDNGLFIDPDDGLTYIYVFAQVTDSNVDPNYALIKYNADLVEQWVRTYVYVQGDAYPSAFAVDSNGNAYLTGRSETAAGFMAYATVKFDKNGEEVWDIGYDLDGQGDEAKAIAVDNDGNVYVTGVASYRGPWNTNTHSYIIMTDCVTVKYNADGDQQWEAQYDLSGDYESCEDIAVDSQGNVYVAGDGNTDVDYDRDFFTIKYNATGVEQWVNQWDGGSNYADWISAIAVDNRGLVYITGQSKTDTAYHSDYVTIAYDTDGNELWVQRYNNGNTGAYSSHDNKPVAMLVKDDGNVYVTGRSTGIDTGHDFGTVKYSQIIEITDDDLPLVTEVTPVDLATGIAVTSLVTATFSEPMDPLNIEDSDTFTLQETLSATPVSGTVLYDDVSMIARFTADAALAYNTQFTATISTAATDVSGNALAEDRVWQFTTLPRPDTTAPWVTEHTPNELYGVEVSPLITVSFNEPMAGGSISYSTFTLVNTSTGSEVDGTVSYDTGTQIARFDLTSALAYSTNYTAMVSSEVTDFAGNPLDANYSWGFTTGAQADTTAPEVVPGSLSPASGAIGVAVNLATVSASFSESMDGETISSTPLTLFNDTTGTTVSDGVVSYNAGSVTLTLASDLAYASSYTATIPAAVEDIAGNPLGTDFSWSFSTENEPVVLDDVPPQVIAAAPAGASVPASVGAISVSFSEPVQAIDDVFFTVSAFGNDVTGTVHYDTAAMTAWFYPSSNLEFNTDYTVTALALRISDLAGNDMLQDYVSTFSTGGDPALAGCEPELQQEAGCDSFDYFTYGTGVAINTYGSSITGPTTESAARSDVSYDQPLTEASIETSVYESQAVARVDSTGFSLRSRSRRLVESDELAGAWSMGASKVDVSGVPPGTLIPMSIVMSGNFTGNGGALLLQVYDFDNYRGLGSVSVVGSGHVWVDANGNSHDPITYTQMIDPYGSKLDTANYVKTTDSGSNNIRLDFLYPAVPNNGIYVWFVAGVHSSLASGETDFTATLEVNPPPGVTVTLASGKVFAGELDTDGDGVADSIDTDLDNAAVASPESVSGTGYIMMDVSDIVGATLSQVEVVDDDDLSLLQDGKPADMVFPDGLVSFRLNGLTPGETVEVTLAYPTPFPNNPRYYKVNETGFYEFPYPYAVFDENNNTVTLTITDGGFGDNDHVANGVIDDPGGVGVVVATNDPVSSSSGGGGGAFGSLMLFAMFLMSIFNKTNRRWMQV